jgi:hypothetical protein
MSEAPEMPERIWAVHYETQGSVMIGEWGDTIRHIGDTEYIRADLVEAAVKRAIEACADIALALANPMDGQKNKAQAEYIKAIASRKIADLATDPEAIAKIIGGGE